MHIDSEMLFEILNALPMGVMFCDKDCNIRFVNKEYARILEKSPDEIEGKKITEVIPGSRAPDVLASGKDELADLCTIPGKGKLNSAVVNRIVLHSPGGELKGMISQAMFSNVSELQSLSTKISQLDRKLLSYKQQIQTALSSHYTIDSIFGNDEALLEQKRLLTRYALVDSPVLILGETGTGKELFAHALHAASNRSHAPLVSINCAAIPKELFESELFGYVEGAFSGAYKGGKVGQVELADNGTLFLDEIGDLSQSAQAKLLRLLESKTLCRLGSVKTRSVDFRLVCATNQNLQEMVANGLFREDLFYRISPLIITIPPLRQRQDDIPLIIKHFLKHLDREKLRFSPDAMRIMSTYSWPGNIRALRNVITYATSICSGNIVEIQHLPAWLRERITAKDVAENCEHQYEISKGGSLYNDYKQQESHFFMELLRKSGGNVTEAAKTIGVSRATLYNKFRKYGVDYRKAMREA